MDAIELGRVAESVGLRRLLEYGLLLMYVEPDNVTEDALPAHAMNAGRVEDAYQIFVYGHAANHFLCHWMQTSVRMEMRFHYEDGSFFLVARFYGQSPMPREDGYITVTFSLTGAAICQYGGYLG